MAESYNTFCPSCECEVSAIIVQVPSVIKIDGEPVVCMVKTALCPECDNVIGDSRIEAEALENMYRIAYKQKPPQRFEHEAYLKPCAFCGGKAVEREKDGQVFAVCKSCGCQSRLCNTEKQLEDVWNRRPECYYVHCDDGCIHCSNCDARPDIPDWMHRNCPSCGAKVIDEIWLDDEESN